MVSSTEQLFYELMRVSLNVQDSLSQMPSEDQWLSLYAMAEKHSVSGVCFAGVLKLLNCDATDFYGMGEDLYYQWAAIALQIQQRNDVLNRQCVQIQAMISEAGFNSFIMKGQGNAAFYDESTCLFSPLPSKLSLLRQPGDIDVFLDGGFEKVNEFVQRTSPTNEINELEIHFHYFHDTEVEIHYRPFIMRNPFKNNRLQLFLKGQYEACYENKIMLCGAGEITVPTVQFNLVHQMVHIFHHFFTGGVGLRQMMDYYIILKSQQADETEINQAKEIVSMLGLNRFASALMWALKYVFEDNQPIDSQSSLINRFWQPCEKDGRFFLDEVMLAGNFGRYDKRFGRKPMTKWQSFWRINYHNLHIARFDRYDWFWGPTWRLYHFVWRRLKGYK